MNKQIKILTCAVIILSLLTVMFAILIPVFNSELKKNLYPSVMIIAQVDEATNTVTCRDCTGNLWQFKGIEDWDEGDLIAIIMNSKGTSEIYDDEIVKIEYCGSTLSAEG